MSRIGNAPINLPQGVTIEVNGSQQVKVKGPKGELVQDLRDGISVEVEEGQVKVVRPTDQKRHKSLHGLYRSLINNMVTGVSEGYKVQLELVGVGYRASTQGQVLDLSVGYSHNVLMKLPPEVKVNAEMQKGKNPIVTLESIDKQLLGHMAAKIRSIRKPEPYKGKGIRFVGEQIRRKAGKAAGA